MQRMKGLLKSRIARRLLLNFLFVLATLMILSLAMHFLSIRILEDRITQSYNSSLTILSRQLNENLAKLETFANAIKADNDINALNQSPDIGRMIWDYASLLKQMKFFAVTNEIESDITIYLLNKERKLSAQRGLDKLTEQDRLDLNREQDQNRWLFQTDARKPDGFNLSFVSYNKQFQANGNLALRIDIDHSQIRKLLNKLKLGGSESAAFLLDSRGGMITSDGSSQAIMAKVLLSIDVNHKLDGQFDIRQNKQNYWIIYTKSEDSQLVFGMYFPRDDVIQPILVLRKWIAVILIVTLMMYVLLTFLTYRSILKPVYSIVDAMRQLKIGKFETRIPDAPNNEVGFVITQFNSMANQIDTLINQVYGERLKQQQSQLKFLQSQINPHFLYNCLFFIYQMAKGDYKDVAAEMALYLGKYFRFATKSGEGETTLRQEIENLEIYMQIQKMRYTQKVEFRVEVDEELAKIRIPSLIIQPLVENAIVHGVETVSKPCHIRVKAYRADNRMIIDIEDDAKTLSDEKLTEIHDGIHHLHANSLHNSVGLSNTHMRLRLKYGESAGIVLSRIEPEGTSVRITIPIPGSDSDVSSSDRG